MKTDQVIIFSDGSSRGNPGPGGWGAVLVFLDGKNDVVKELGGGGEETTNNRMELTAAIEAFVFLKKKGVRSRLTLYTDSSYLLNGATLWLPSWQRNNWKTKTKQDVLNRDLWEKLSLAIEGVSCDWKQIKGHAGVAGNERCDVIATAFADRAEVRLYDGPLSGYTVPILNVSFEKTSQKKKSSKAKAYSYVSSVHGIISIDKSWAECEARVKGKKGAKYKKVFSKEEEGALINEWNSNDTGKGI